MQMIFLKDIFLYLPVRAAVIKLARAHEFKLVRQRALQKDALNYDRYYNCLCIAKKDLKPLLRAIKQRLAGHKYAGSFINIKQAIKELEGFLKEQG